jgi:hypothetical protein
MITLGGDEAERVTWCCIQRLRISSGGGQHLACVGGARSLRVFPFVRGRYQYLNLVNFLEHGTWEDPAPHLVNHQEWGPWSEFMMGVRNRLGGGEVCDCRRSNAGQETFENRWVLAGRRGMIRMMRRIMARTIMPDLMTAAAMAEPSVCAYLPWV